MDKNYDVIIAGAGAAGLYTALNLPEKAKILLIAKRELILCNSALAQGGIAAVYRPENDTVQLHTNDTLIAGGFKNNPDSVNILVTGAACEIQTLLDIGVDFDKCPDGSFDRTLEGGHSRRRIFHHKDSTGFEITSKLQQEILKHENITVMDNTMLGRIRKTDKGFSAELVINNRDHITCHSRFLVLATGGIGRIYERTTNSAIATGDGIAAAYELGAQIKHLSYIQFHPTAFADKETRECFLISESVRGEGAYLLNDRAERFMRDYDERMELAPRDVVSHAIITESRRRGSDEFYLDITYKPADYIRERFPMIYKNLLEHGIDMTKDKIPVFPCQHYLMGGINVNTNSETTVKGLYAAGECSHTGVHGNNRLASNSLLEALVFGHRAAMNIAEKLDDPFEYDDFEFAPPENAVPVPSGIRTEVRRIMQRSYFVIPDMQEAVSGFQRVCELKQMLETGSFVIDRDFIEAKAITECAYLILKEVI